MYLLVRKKISNELGVYETQDTNSAVQHEILQNQKIVCHPDKDIWVYQKEPGGFDTVVEVTTEVFRHFPPYVIFQGGP